MSKSRHAVRYAQFADTDRNGEVTFDDQTRLASGRLDHIGSVVVAEGFACGDDKDLVAVVEVTRTTATTVDIALRISLWNARAPFHYDFIHTEHITGVPLVTVPTKASSMIDHLRGMGGREQRVARIHTAEEPGD